MRSLKDLEEQWVAKEVTLSELTSRKCLKIHRFILRICPMLNNRKFVLECLQCQATMKIIILYPLLNTAWEEVDFEQQLKHTVSDIKRRKRIYIWSLERNTVKSPFIASSSVKSDVTDKALSTFKEIIKNYGENYTKEDLQKTKNSLLRANALKFQTLPGLLNVLQTMSTYGLPLDYIERQQQVLQNLRLDEVKELIDNYLDPSKMVYVIVGDKATQFKKLKEIESLIDPVEITPSGIKNN